MASAVGDLRGAVEAYNRFLGARPALVVPEQYALYRTPQLNLSLRKTDDAPGTIRHLGFEDERASAFTEFKDNDGVVWERFTAEQQAQEIRAVWPEVEYAVDSRPE